MDTLPASIDFFPEHCIVPVTGNTEKDGYFVLGIGKGQTNRAHRVAYRLFVGLIPKDIIVMHTCDNPGCINPKHLALGTETDKTRKTAKHYFGAQIHNAKLTPDIVREIRKSDLPLKELADRYGVVPTCIAKVKSRQSWKTVKDIEESGNVYN